MSTCRRRLLDKALKDAATLMRGRVLDIGGKKYGKRGSFRPPLKQVTCWEYLNLDPDTQPDYCCDAAKIGLEDNSIDTVVMTEVLEYLASPADVLSEIYRLLKNDGTCILSVPFLHPVHGDDQLDRQRWTAVKLEQACRKAGFGEIKIEPMGSVWSVLHDILHVWLGYSRPNPDKIYLRALRKLLHTATPFFLWLDNKTGVSKKHINTGYFVILKKMTGYTQHAE
jgi:SAM-dependent methyltransferase